MTKRSNGTKRSDGTFLWSTLHGVQCRMAAYDEGQCQVILLWHAETIKTTVVSGYAAALLTSRTWRQECDAKHDIRDTLDSSAQ